MNLITLIKLEWYKQKKGWIWLFLLIIPAGTTLAMFLDFSMRYDYLLESGSINGLNSWDLLLIENHRILGWGMFLPMFIGIIYALVYQLESSQQNWKHYLALPVSKESVYLSKFLTGFMFSFLLILLNMLGLILVGFIMGFPEEIDWSGYSMYVVNQAIMILAVAGLHNWLSSFFNNNIIPIVIGFAGVILSSIVSFQFPEGSKLFPYTFPFYTDGVMNEPPIEIMFYSLIMMIAFLVSGMWHFKHKDIL